MVDMKKEELIKKIEDTEITYDYDETYTNLYNTCIDYMNDTQDWSLEYLFEDFIDYETAEIYAKQQLEDGGLIRLYYFLGDANLNNDLFKINGYGNLTDVYKDDLEWLKDEILNTLKDGEDNE